MLRNSMKKINICFQLVIALIENVKWSHSYGLFYYLCKHMSIHFRKCGLNLLHGKNKIIAYKPAVCQLNKFAQNLNKNKAINKFFSSSAIHCQVKDV